MAKFLSATDLAIAAASARGTLALVERPSRFGDTYVAVSDDVGIIEVQATMAGARERVADVARRAAS